MRTLVTTFVTPSEGYISAVIDDEPAVDSGEGLWGCLVDPNQPDCSVVTVTLPADQADTTKIRFVVIVDAEVVEQSAPRTANEWAAMYRLPRE